LGRALVSTLVGLVLFVAVEGCASSGGAARRSAPDKLLRNEIAGANASNAYELITRLRPNWLRTAGTGSIAGGVRSQLILVYIDNQRAEDLTALKSVSTAIMESAEWIDATRLPMVLSNVPAGSFSGAILIKTH
jgi:hypothetical protein